MPFIPHTEADIKAMLEAVGVDSIETLFDEIPAELRCGELTKVPPRMSEFEITRLMFERAEQDGYYINFIGAGAYEHHIPAAVWEITTRGEFYSAYTPYQAEASQGTLQVLYEFQTMMASLTGMDVANASLYDGASALAEAVLMAVRTHRKARRVLIPTTVHPVYRQVTHSIVTNQDIELLSVPFSKQGRHNALVIAVVNPVALALLAPPGEWGDAGADIVVGEGQPLGAPLSSGGPYFGFMCCRQAHVRQMPGRIVGRTVDATGNPGFTLTLQAREQHIRRSKATSNICTNQGLLVTAATIHMALLGPEGLERVAAQCHANTLALLEKLTAMSGVERVFDRPVFHEAVLRLSSPANDVLRALEGQGILGGYNLTQHYPELGEAILVCATETRGHEDIDKYTFHMERIISKRRLDPPSAVKANPKD
jgi:glycine dehydrogenase subunit 1